MTVKFPFWGGDFPRLLDLLTWIHQLGGCKGHDALLIADDGVEWSVALQAKQLALKSFDRCEIITTNESVIGWPGGPNNLFLTALQHSYPKGGPWLWMETDAVPLHPDWVNIIQGELGTLPAVARFYKCDQPNHPPLVASGIAAFNPGAHMQEIHDGAFGSMWRAFDLSINDVMIRVARNTNRIQHLWGENKDAPPIFDDSVMPRPKGFMRLNEIEPDVILFHRNKDGSLIRKLRQQRNIPTVNRPNAPATPPLPRPQISVRRTGALGDVLAASCVVTKLQEQGFEVEYQTHASAHCILRRTLGITHISNPKDNPDVNLDGAYEGDPNRRLKHFAQMFIDSANRQLRNTKITGRNFAPKMSLTKNDIDLGEATMRPHPKPWTVIVPRSNSWVTRTVPDSIWQRAASQIHGTKFWLGNHAPAPSGIVDLNCRHFDNAIAYLGTADLVVTVDTGPMHVAAALGTPVVAIEQQHSPEHSLSDKTDFVVVKPGLTCLSCEAEQCPINPTTPPCQNISPDIISKACNEKLQYVTTDGVSVVICIYKPQAAKLNKAIRHIIDQVQEIVVVVDEGGYIPQGAYQDGKIRYLKLKQRDVGLSRKMNFGFRHTNNRMVLWLNDDCYMNPDAVQKLKECMYDDVGLVGCELRYPDGTLQHGGTYRPVGSFG